MLIEHVVTINGIHRLAIRTVLTTVVGFLVVFVTLRLAAVLNAAEIPGGDKNAKMNVHGSVSGKQDQSEDVIVTLVFFFCISQ